MLHHNDHRAGMRSARTQKRCFCRQDILVQGCFSSLGIVVYLLETNEGSVTGPVHTKCNCAGQVALVLPSVEKAFGMGWLYTGFAIVTAVAWTVIYLIVLETKGKSLEEIEAFLMRKEVTPEGKPVSIFTRTRSFNKAGLVQRREKVSTAKRGAAV